MKTMTTVEDRQQDENCPQIWLSETPNLMVADLLTRLCPDYRCSDVDRAILGASLGG